VDVNLVQTYAGVVKSFTWQLKMLVGLWKNKSSPQVDVGV
jgi:hypothetical protein